MERFEQNAQENFQIGDIEDIEKMPETTLEEVRAKKQACNDLIITLGRLLPQIHAESGSNSLDDESQEESQDIQNIDLLRSAMDRARSEMERLGDKQEELEKAA
jgi:hypothetical protein